MNTPEKCPKCGAELLSQSFGELTFYCGSRNSHPSQDSVWLQESAVCIRNQRDQLAERVRELEAWKEAAMAVERQWDSNQLAAMLGGQLGEPQRAVIQWKVPVLVQRVKRLESSADTLIDAIQSVQCWNGTYVGECIEQLESAKSQP